MPPLDTRAYDRDHQFIVGVDVAELAPAPLTLLEGEGTGVSRILSRGGEGGASEHLELTAGWQSPKQVLEFDLEIFVLSGVLAIGNRELGTYGYAAVPGGERLPAIEARSDCRLLMFSEPACGGAAYVAERSLFDLPWVPPYTPGLASGLLVKILREHPVTTARTWAVGLMQWGRDITQWEEHPMAEECYLLEGELINTESLDDGIATFTYGPGGYFYRPPHIRHSGPGTLVARYALALFRSPRRLVTEWHEDPTSFPDSCEVPEVFRRRALVGGL